MTIQFVNCLHSVIRLLEGRVTAMKVKWNSGGEEADRNLSASMQMKRQAIKATLYLQWGFQFVKWAGISYIYSYRPICTELCCLHSLCRCVLSMYFHSLRYCVHLPITLIQCNAPIKLSILKSILRVNKYTIIIQINNRLSIYSHPPYSF